MDNKSKHPSEHSAESQRLIFNVERTEASSNNIQIKIEDDSENKHKYNSNFLHPLDAPYLHRNSPISGMMNRHRNSEVSKQSIELFLLHFPADDTEYTNNELVNTFADIMTTDIGIDSKMTTIEKLRLILRSNKFKLLMILLVIIDCICVLIQIVIDILHSGHHLFEIIIEYLSCCLLSTFLIEVFFKIILIPRVFFKSKLEIFDALIVCISLSLEIVSIIGKDQIKEVEAGVITFRLENNMNLFLL